MLDDLTDVVWAVRHVPGGVCWCSSTMLPATEGTARYVRRFCDVWAKLALGECQEFLL